jgi:hypothetical protein
MSETKEPILAWHFVGAHLRDGRPIPDDGVPLIHRGKVVPCEQGMHASVRLRDGLKYAPGETLCRVSCTGTVVQQTDQLACSQRTILWRIDATAVLREFARKCALDVAHLWDMSAVVREYLETGREDLRDAAGAAAWAAAWAAAEAAARAAARAAAGDGAAACDAARAAAWDGAAAWAAAEAAARAAARAAAWAAAWDGAAAWAAAEAAARAAARAAAGDAAWDGAAAWAAARAAAGDAQNAHLEAMVQMQQARSLR